MKPVSMLLALVLTMGVAGCDDTEPSEDVQYTFTAPLTVAAEVPTPSGPETSGSGAVTIVLNVVRDNDDEITSATANFSTTLTNFPQSTNFTQAHIHRGATGVRGDIVVDTGLPSGSVTLTNGAGSFTRNDQPVSTTIANELINDAAGFYFNVHTTANGPGIVRGQLVKQ